MSADLGRSKIQADYDELASIANELVQESQSIKQLSNQVMHLVGQLEGGAWIGRGAQAFYAEMNDQVEPGLRRLIGALGDGNDAVKQINTIFSQAAQDASPLSSRR